MNAEKQYITKTEVLKKFAPMTLGKLNDVLEELGIETVTSNRDKRLQLISMEDVAKIEKYFKI